MKPRQLFYLLITLLTFSVNSAIAQNIGGTFYYSPDSLAGFDEMAIKGEAMNEGLYGQNLKTYLANQQRHYINTKYGLWEKEDTNPGSNSTTGFGLKNIGGGNIIVNAAPCVNEGFETSTLAGWTASAGVNLGSQNYPLTPTVITQGAQVNVVTTPFSDPFVGTIPNSPFPGSKVAIINNSVTPTARAIKIAQTFPVTLTNYLYDFAYYAVMENASNPHNCTQTPYMTVRIRNFAGTLQACPNFSIVAPSTPGGCAGIGPTTWITYTVGTRIVRGSNGWQKFAIDMTPYMGQNVTVEVVVAHCSLTGHFGYSYFDSNCGTMNVTVNGTPYSMPTATTNVTGLCGASATMVAPNGLSPYSWNGPPGSGITGNTNQTITTSVAGNYTLNMSPPGICNPPISKIVRLTFPPSTTLTASPATVCPGGSSTLTAIGATNYTWSTGANTNSIVVSPVANTNYFVIVQTGTCIGTRTIQVRTSQNPTLTITNSNPNLCTGGNSTLTSNGAVNYVWSPGGATGSMVVVSPASTTVYTVTGTNIAGCIDTETTTVSVATPTPASVLAINPASGSICIGSSILVGGFGAASFSWYPSSPLIVGGLVTLTPTVTTTYTAIGGTGSCTNSAMITVTVDQGPPITAVSNPTIICPGNTATLSATAVGAIGSLTWQPSGTQASSIQVSPPVTTNYTVQGKNANGCVRTVTINQLVAPVPTITIVPTTPTVCIGGAVMLSASGGITYSWTPGGPNTNTKVVSPLVTTSYTVAVSNGTCISTKSTTVTVIPLPTLSTASTPTAVCVGNSATLTATGATNYTWMPGSLPGGTVTVTPPANTTYTVTGELSGCSNTATRSVVVNPRPTINVSATPANVCQGFCSTLTPSGALTYTYLNGGPSVCPLVTTTYSVNGTNNFGCTNINPGTVSVIVNPTPTITITPSSPSICVGSSATLTASGGNTYTWSTGATGGAIVVSPLVTTSYTVTGASALGCTAQKTITIIVVPKPTVSASASPTAVCLGNAATLTGNGATTYTWQPGNLPGASVSVTPAVNTTYTVTGNTAGCTNTAVTTVVVNPRPTINVTASPASVCPGNCTTLTPSGAVSYTSTPAAPYCPLVTTTYSFMGTNSFGCVSTNPGTVTVVVNPTPTINITASSTSVCAGGSATLTATGATSYTWNTGPTTAAIVVSPLVSTTYTVTGANATGCTSQKTISIIVVPNPTVNVTASPAAVCAGNCATLTASNATSYTWMPGNLSGASIVVCPTITATYSVTGSTGGCSNTRTITVTVNNGPTLSAVANPATVCPGGTSTLTAPGTAVSYTWLPMNLNTASVVVSPLTTQIYTVIGATGSGCTTTRTVSVNTSTIPVINITASSNTVCSGSPVTLSASGGVTYTWSTGAFTPTISVSPLVTTVYTVTGANASGCTGQNTITITVIPKPIVSASASPTVLCPGGTAVLTATGATTYTWSTGSTLNPTSVTPSLTTIYTVTGSLNGCNSNPASVTVSVSSAPLLSVVNPSPSPICPGISSTLSTSGAVSYTWMPGNLSGSSIVVSPTITTSYTVTGANAAGCTATRTATVIVYPSLTVNVTANTDTICSGSSAILTASGASFYSWNPGPSSANPRTVSPTVSTVYTVTGTNTLGCSQQKTIAIIVIASPTVTITKTPASICQGQSATLTASGALSYSWSTGSSSSVIVVSPSVTTSYSVIGMQNSCSAMATTILTVNPAPTIFAIATPTAICAGTTATLSAGGGITYTWSPGPLPSASSVTVSPSATTIYTVTATGAFACIGGTTVMLTVNPNPTISTGATPASICAGQSSTLTASGASSYTWNPGSLPGSPVVVTPPSTTNYTVIGSLGTCTSSATSQVTVNAIPVLSAGASPGTICQGSSATLTVTGATSYTWSPGGMNGSVVTVTPSSTTVYQVTGSNASGCTGTATVTVVVSPTFTFNASATSPVICAGQCTSLTASGAISYTWNPGNTNGASISVCPLSSTNYTVAATNALGCISTRTVSVTVNPLPTIIAAAVPAVICAGQTSSLTIFTTGTTFTWNPGNMTSNPSVVSPVSTTVYTVVATLGTCTASATRTVQVLPSPVVTATANPASICAGSSVTLSASGALTYGWAPILATGATVTDTPLSTTVYTVVGVNSFSCFNTATVSVTVNNLPTVSITSSNSTICSGASELLTGSGATNYTWNPGGSTGSTFNASPASTTVYTLTGSNGAGCTNTATFTLNVTPTPTLIASSSSPTVCAGFTVDLSATGGSSYTWQPGGMTGSPVNVTVAATTNYTVTSNNGNCVASAMVNVTAVPLPTISAITTPSAVCSGDSMTLTASGAVTYTWLPMFQSGTSIVVNPVATTVYTLVGQAASGCPNAILVTANVNPSPVVTAISTSTGVCTGSSATLTASGATGYTWNPGGQTGASIVVSPLATTIYTVTGDNGSCTGTTTIAVNVNPLPVITAQASPTMICEGSQVTLSASGAVNYTWNPTGLTGSPINDLPLVTTSYTVTGEDANGCINQANITVTVNPNPIISASSSPGSICEGSSVTLNASGALTYNWIPGNLSGSTVTDTPLATTIYTVSGTDANGCSGTSIVLVTVVPNPTLSVTPLNSSVCVGSSATLIASGATNYTWLPSGTNAPVTIETPLVNTTYTVIGENGGICFASFTVDVFVNPLPANVTATSSGTITCSTPSVNLSGSSTDTNVNYNWSGPLSYTSNVQNPTGVTVWGTFTLTVTDNLTGCSATATVDVPTDNSIPLVNAVTSGSITCAASSVTINAVHTTTNPGYSWTGPSAFTSTLQTFTVSVPGDYTVVVTDLTSTCASSAVVSVGIHTAVVTTATISAATCSAGISNNDGTIMVSSFGALDKFDLVSGTTYTGTATYPTAVIIPTSGIVTNNLANPTTTVAYTLRIFDSEGCIKDTTLFLIPTDCALKTLGIAKAVSTPSLNEDGTYNVTYKVTVKNYETTALTNVTLVEDLSATFVSPSTFSIAAAPQIITSGSGLTLNTAFDGVTQVNLLGSNSSIAGNVTDTLTFTVKIKTNSFFGPYHNRILGLALNSNSIAISDSSTTGLDPDPDNDGNPYNNSTVTTLTLAPNVFFGLTKVGAFQKQDDNSYDISYTVTVHNLGNDTLRNITVQDSLFENTIRQPATYVIKSAPVTSGSLVANALFNGNSDVNLLNSDQSIMPPGFVSTISFVINVQPDTVSVIRNSATGRANKSADLNNPVFVSDSSNAGTNPDSNNNKVWNEPADNVPTVLILPTTHTLFIPQGFSPNGDGINDQFVIKGLPDTDENSLTIFNRWGNRVYFHANYNNLWDGYPNIAGTLGKDKLPQGTYYYILDMKGSGSKPITGFIVLQY